MKKISPAVIGLGYVGLPIFLRLRSKFKCLGFDTNQIRVAQLNKGLDINNEFNSTNLKKNKTSKISSNRNELKKSNFFIITVPTPIKNNKKPDLSYLEKAFKILKKVIKNNDIIFLESTVYPGITKFLSNKYFKRKKIYIGYSPERINPGDKKNTIQNIKKIVAFEKYPSEIIRRIKNVYRAISKKLVFSNSIENAEMSKVIENIQRDINVAFMNEILMVSEKLNLNFKEVFKLASTKWNFLKFSPGLVGGHCLPVDPFYLYHLAKVKGHDAKFMLAGRIVNDDLKTFIINKIQKEIKNKKLKNILILGLTYKANVSDIRNSLALDIFKNLKKKFKNKIHGYDPVLNFENSKKIKSIKKLNLKNYDLIVPLLNHKILEKKIAKHFKQNTSKYMDILNYFS